MSDEDPSSEEEDPSSNKDPSRYDHPPNNEDQEERPSPGSPAKSQSSADERLCDLPGAVGSPTKLQASCTVSSTSSSDASEDDADAIVFDVNTRHVNLLEPPSTSYDTRKKPKPLSRK